MGVSKASLRGLSIDQRMDKMREANKPKTVRVTPVNDDIRRVLSHPQTGNFPAEGSMVWPDDGFTLRRVQDGDIKIVEESEQQPAEEQPQEKQEKQSSKGAARGAS